MNRRHFLNMGLVSTAALSLPVRAAAAGWRTFELNYEVELLGLEGPADLWLPLPQTLGNFQRVETPVFKSNADSNRFIATRATVHRCFTRAGTGLLRRVSRVGRCASARRIARQG